MDDVLGSIEGTATFERVVITDSDAGDALFELTGYYHGSTTTYRAPELRIEGLEVDGRFDGEVTFEVPEDDEFVWVVADGRVLSVHSEEPEEVEE